MKISTPFLNKYDKLTLLFIVICHGLMLFINGAFWDGIQVTEMIRDDEWDLMQFFFAEHGNPIGISLHAIFFLFDPPNFGYKLLSFACVLITPLLIRRFLLKIEGLKWTDQEATLISIFAVSFPMFSVYFEVIMFPYLICTVFFWWGNLLLSKFYFNKGSVDIKTWILALFLILMSFNIASFVVIFAAFIGLITIIRQDSPPIKFQFTWKYLPLLSLVAIYFIYSKVFPPQGIYENYNQYGGFSISKFLIAHYGLVYNTIIGQLLIYKEVLVNHFLLVIAMIIPMYFLIKSLFKNAKNPFNIWLLVVGILIFLVGAFPYILVGKTPGGIGWNSRHALLLLLPAGIIYIALIRILPSLFQVILTSVLLSIFCAFHIDNYLAWQARSVKDLSLIENLKSQYPTNDNYDILLVKDDNSKVKNEGYRYYEYSVYFKRTWGNEKTVGFDVNDYGDKLEEEITDVLDRNWNERELDFKNIKDFNFQRRNRHELIVQQKNNTGDLKICMDYYANKWFGSDADLKQFKQDFLTLNIQAIGQ